MISPYILSAISLLISDCQLPIEDLKKFALQLARARLNRQSPIGNRQSAARSLMVFF